MHTRAKNDLAFEADAAPMGMLEYFGDKGAPVAILGWGSTIGPVREAVERAQEEGMPVAVLYTKMIFPLPRKEIAEFIAQRKAIIVPELNYTGQYARMIQAEFWREVDSLRNPGGAPFATRDIYAEIKRVYSTLEESGKKPAAKKKPAVKRRAVSKKKAPLKKTARRK